MLSKIKLKFLQSVKSKRLNVFGLFLLVSFLILVVTKLSESYVETIPFTITYKNLPETNVITLDSIPKLNVTISTHGFNLLSYYFYNKNYELDFENSTYIKDKTYVWLAEKGTYNLKEQLGNTITIVSVKPDTLRLPFGTMSVKKVPIVLNSEINFAAGYDTTEAIRLVPDSVKVIGAEEELLKIDHINTKPLNLDRVKTDVNATIGLDFENGSKRLKLSEDKVTVKAVVEKFTEGNFEVPVSIINLPKDLEVNYFPKHIKVSYYVSLKDYKDIKLTDFKIECDYEEVMTSGDSFFKPRLIVQSDKVKSSKMKQNKVEYIILK